jgi:ADP-heptose:LPS heptosyltransferase
MDYWLGIPLLNLFAICMKTGRRRAWPTEIRRVGLMCSPALGDTLLFSAVEQDVRTRFPRTELIHFCMKQNVAAAELLPWADRRVIISLTKPAESIRRMRSEQLDVFLDFTSWQRLTAFYSLMAGAKFTAGFETAGQSRGRGYDVRVEHRSDRHEVDNFRALIESVGISAGSQPGVVVPTVGEEPLAAERDLVVFHLWASGTRSWLREWPQDRWLALAKRLSRPETCFVITGAPSDQIRAVPFVKRMLESGLKAVAFSGSDGFVSLAHVLNRARVVVSVNTGVMHLAAVLGAPTVSINGPTRNSRWGPIGKYAVGVEAPGGGYLHLGFEFNGNPSDCVERISVERVLAAAQAMEAERWGSREMESVSERAHSLK